MERVSTLTKPSSCRHQRVENREIGDSLEPRVLRRVRECVKSLRLGARRECVFASVLSEFCLESVHLPDSKRIGGDSGGE
eukprot:718456-Rhodomonas_salina.1